MSDPITATASRFVIMAAFLRDLADAVEAGTVRVGHDDGYWIDGADVPPWSMSGDITVWVTPHCQHGEHDHHPQGWHAGSTITRWEAACLTCGGIGSVRCPGCGVLG